MSEGATQRRFREGGPADESASAQAAGFWGMLRTRFQTPWGPSHAPVPFVNRLPAISQTAGG